MISLIISLYCSNWLIPDQCEKQVIACIEKNIERGDIEDVTCFCIDNMEGESWEK